MDLEAGKNGTVGRPARAEGDLGLNSRYITRHLFAVICGAAGPN